MRLRFIKGYYWATPALWLIDILWGVNVRAAGFESYPLMKHVYFAACLGCAYTIWKNPAWFPAVGLAESAVNICSLILGIFGPYYRMLGSISEDAAVIQNPFSIQIVINFVLAGTAACVSFYSGGLSTLRDNRTHL